MLLKLPEFKFFVIHLTGNVGKSCEIYGAGDSKLPGN